ncbi:MAG: hypothetical protein K2W99_07885 [Chthoniobacterales bacterium]|nr:hypothetical protein [Chthoniobacterales bacterium]
MNTNPLSRASSSNFSLPSEAETARKGTPSPTSVAVSQKGGCIVPLEKGLPNPSGQLSRRISAEDFLRQVDEEKKAKATPVKVKNVTSLKSRSSDTTSTTSSSKSTKDKK